MLDNEFCHLTPPRDQLKKGKVWQPTNVIQVVAVERFHRHFSVSQEHFPTDKFMHTILY